MGEKVSKVNFAFFAVIAFALGLAAAMGSLIMGLGAACALAFVMMVLADYEKSIYILAGYSVIDYALRTFVGGVLASAWDEAYLLALILLWIYKWMFRRKEKPFKAAPMDLPIVIFITVMLVALIVNSPDFSISLEGFRAIVQYILWYFLVLQLVRDEKGAKGLVIFFVAIVGLMAIHGVYQYIIGVEMPAGWVDQNEAGVRTRVYSILTSPNIFGSLLTLATPMAVSLFFTEKQSGKKLVYGGLSLMMLASLVFTSSRGAWIGFAVAFLVYVLLNDKRLIVPGVVAMVLVIVLVPSVGNRITYMLSPEYIESSLKGGRLVRWLTGIRILEFYPVWGLGLGHFGGAVAMNHEMSTIVDTNVVQTFYMDNYYLKTAVESGIVGLAAFVMLMYQVIINGLRVVKLTEGDSFHQISCGILAGLTGVIVHNFVENVFEVPLMTTVFWVFVGVLMAVWYSKKHGIKKEESIEK
jgi:O-antigen ligase